MLFLYLTFIEDTEDKKLFEELFYSYRKQMVTLANSYLHNKEDSEDVVHDVFLRIAQKYMDTIRNIESKDDLRNYLLKATKNTALNYIKKKSKIKSSIDILTEYEKSQMEKLSNDDFVDAMCNRIEYDALVKVICALNDRYKFPLYYHFVLELSVPQIAKLLNQTLATTKKQLVRGKRLLLNSLDHEGDDYNVS